LSGRTGPEIEPSGFHRAFRTLRDSFRVKKYIEVPGTFRIIVGVKPLQSPEIPDWLKILRIVPKIALQGTQGTTNEYKRGIKRSSKGTRTLCPSVVAEDASSRGREVGATRTTPGLKNALKAPKRPHRERNVLPETAPLLRCSNAPLGLGLVVAIYFQFSSSK
jgi:hypothetical protein